MTPSPKLECTARNAANLAAGLTIAQIVGKLGGGGVQRLASNLAVGLHEIGARSIIISVRGAADADPPREHEVVHLGAGGSLWHTGRAMFELRRVLSSRGVNGIHVHGQGCLPFTALALAGMAKRPNLWFTWHNSESVLEEPGVRGRLLRWALGQCDHICGSSDQVVRKLSAAGFRVPISVFRNGVPKCSATSRIDDPEPTILWLARLVPPKNPSMLIRAASQLRREGLRFRIILAGDPPPGMGWFGEETRALVHSLGLADVISMPGWIADTVPLLSNAAIGVQTSDTEGLSMTLLEQMMAGLAIVATDVGDTRRAIEHDETGLLIPIGEETALTTALRRLITDPELRRHLGHAARQRAMNEFSLSVMARNALEFYATQPNAST